MLGMYLLFGMRSSPRGREWVAGRALHKNNQAEGALVAGRCVTKVVRLSIVRFLCNARGRVGRGLGRDWAVAGPV